MRINFGVDQSRDWTLLDEEEKQSVSPPQWNPPSGTPPAGDDTSGGSGTAVKVVGALLLVGFGWWFTRGTS